MLQPLRIDEESPFRDEHCALCKEAFGNGDVIVICPEDAARHHVLCWQANDNHCSAYGCLGQGVVGERSPARVGRLRTNRRGSRSSQRAMSQPFIIDQGNTEDRSKVRTLPSSNFGCAQACLILAVVALLALVVFTCFGAWALYDFLATDIFGPSPADIRGGALGLLQFGLNAGLLNLMS